MSLRIRRMMLFLGTTILVIQAVFMPIGMFSAETIEEDSTEDSRFFFTQSQWQGMAKTPLQIEFFSDQEVSEARVLLPEEATLLKDQLLTGISVEEGEQPNEWIVQSKRAQNTFVLPIVFLYSGNYEIAIGEATASFEIGEQETIEEETTISAGIPTTKITKEAVDKDPRVVNPLADSVYLGAGSIVNGLPEDRNLWVPGTIFLNSMEVSTLAELAEKVLVNGNRVTSAQLTTQPYLSIDSGRGTGVVDISDVGKDQHGNLIDVRMTVTNISNFGLGVDMGPDFRTLQALALSAGRNSSASARVTFDFLDKEGNLINQPIYQSWGSSNRRPYFTFDKSELYSILTNDDSVSVQEKENNVEVRSAVNRGFNLITKSSFSVDIDLEHSFGANYQLRLFRQQGDGVQMVSNPPKIIGHTVEEIFESNYTIEQEVTNYITSDLVIEVDAPEILQKEAPIVEKIVDNEGKLLDWVISETVNGKTTVRFPFEKIKQYEGQLIEFDLSYKIDKSANPEEFLDEEGYLEIPLTARTNYVLNEVKESAKTWAKPWGEAIPQNVAQGADTLNLEATTFVKNLANKLLGDIPFVVGFGEEKVFELLGEDTIDVLIESSISGIQTSITVPVTVIEPILSPVDPIDPEIEVNPENKPEMPEEQGLLSIDFISSFNFGSHAISVHDQTYYAQPQRLLNDDGTVNETEERPNYVQISDRRPDNERSGWQLSVTQNGQFRNKSGHELIGSEIQLFNQELVTAQGGTAPTLQEENMQRIIPNTKKILLQANKESGTGTWIYRFGDQQTANKSVGLYVPGGTNPEATSYSTKWTWEFSSVPDN
ncbi:hypothetical protein IGK38_002980 [Enterococcus pernyi]